MTVEHACGQESLIMPAEGGVLNSSLNRSFPGCSPTKLFLHMSAKDEPARTLENKLLRTLWRYFPSDTAGTFP